MAKENRGCQLLGVATVACSVVWYQADRQLINNATFHSDTTVAKVTGQIPSDNRWGFGLSSMQPVQHQSIEAYGMNKKFLDKA